LSGLSLVLLCLAILAYIVLLVYDAGQARPTADGRARGTAQWVHLQLPDARGGRGRARRRHPRGRLEHIVRVGSAGVFGVFWLAIVTVILVELLALGSLHPRSEAQSGWLLAVVTPQSLSILTLALAGGRSAGTWGLIALIPWMLASILYLPLAAVRVLRLGHARDTVRELRSDDWILMGALAISTLAAADLLESRGHATRDGGECASVSARER
jgi:hypothetical protein